MSHEAEFTRPDRTEPIYGATSTRVTSNDRLGEIPYVPELLVPKPLADQDSFTPPSPVFLGHVDDLLRDILGTE
jgi:hypothetical protein